jgi:beta-glucanase (GH16 family)
MDTPRYHRPGRIRARTLLGVGAATALAAGLTAVLSTGDSDSAEPATADPVAQDGELVWSDEFDAPANTGPDPEKWNIEVNGDGGGNQELQFYSDSLDNLAHDGEGHMVITALEGNPEGHQCHYGTCEYTSGRINTADKFSHAYGRFEARIQIPAGQGIWPAFWMLGEDFPDVTWPDSGEIDIMENVGHEPDVVHGSLHGPGYSGGNPITGSYTHPEGGSFAEDFHVYAVEWTPEEITWFVDDVAYQTFTPADAGDNEWVYDYPFFMLLNVAVGGTWPGPPDESTSFPQEMLIDYVRVYDLG